MNRNNPTWGEERIANELSLKPGIRISPRTVRKYMDRNPRRRKNTSHRRSTFMRNHAKTLIACDFFDTVTARIRVLYVFVAMEVGSRRIIHVNVTDQPTAEWTIQQFRGFLVYDHPYRLVIHDRDAKCSLQIHHALKTFGVRGLKTRSAGRRQIPIVNE
jgi:hypothetical protein